MNHLQNGYNIGCFIFFNIYIVIDKYTSSLRMILLGLVVLIYIGIVLHYIMKIRQVRTSWCLFFTFEKLDDFTTGSVDRMSSILFTMLKEEELTNTPFQY